VKLVVPCFEKLWPADARLVRLAEFLGISCELLSLPETKEQFVEALQRVVPSETSCVVVNPGVIQEWVKREAALPEFASYLVSRFPFLLVHAPRPTPFDGSVISAFSGGCLQSVQEIKSGLRYEVSPDSKDICEAFAGLSFGPANAAQDRVFSAAPGSSGVRSLISIGSELSMAAIRREKTEVLFVGAEAADLSAEVGDAPVTEYFSQLLPHAMALRYIFAEESWRPCEHYASVIIDDPLLRPTYGFLNFEHLLGLMKKHNFRTTIAFIPHNFRRNSRRVTQMFRENAGHFGLCFHGNDHTGGEFASTDRALLNTVLQIAERRMELHSKTTGLECDRVMVFPQGAFSVEAMAVLRSRNFDSAVNTVSHPKQHKVRLTIAEIAQPAVLRYGGFPLFLRKNSVHTQSVDIAFNLFFGRPTFIVEHHDVFQHPERLVDVASRINAVAPAMRWSRLGDAVSNAILRRRAIDGTYQVRAYSRNVRVFNSSDLVERFLIDWKDFGPLNSVERVLREGKPCDFRSDESGIRLSAQLAPSTAETFSVVCGNVHPTLERLGFQRNARAFLRRRLSEVRDNYVSKNRSMMAAAKMIRGRFVH
jgi:hypothetical protein